MIARGVVVLTTVFQLGCSVFGIQGEEEPRYTVISKNKNMEIREYEPYLVAETTVEGDFEESQSKGFRILADYIFGENEKAESISMTAPVEQSKPSEKIAMTAPVEMNPDKANNKWTMTFTMPSKYSMETLPKPKDGRIRIVQRPGQFRAVYRFTGFWNEAKINRYGKELSDWLDTQKDYLVVSEPQFAGYNPPWTLPFFRRNEVLLDLEKR